MSLLIPCSACGQKLPGKMANVTWAWWTAANERVAWRQKLCFDCFASNCAPLVADVQTAPLDCPVCHSDAGENMDPCYLTAFLPGVGPVRAEMGTCAPCAVDIRNRAQAGAVKLDDRQSSFGGQVPGPQTDTVPNVWAQLGILPNE